MKIKPISHVDSHKTGEICGLDKADIDRLLGFEPNVPDDEYKVKYSWAFTVDGEPCAVWDWKGSHAMRTWSAYGPHAVLAKVFGSHYYP